MAAALFRRGPRAAVGVVSQYDEAYSILPRFAEDVSRPPGFLPATGRGLTIARRDRMVGEM